MFLVIIAILSNGITLSAQKSNNSVTLDTVFKNTYVFKGDYFSNNIPDTEPLLFAKGLIDPELHHFHSAPIFSTDYQEMYFSVYLNYEEPQRIFISKKINGIWQKPELANFSGQYQDGRPMLSLDGKTLYFYSKRPIDEGNTPSKNSMIWFVKKNNGTWGKPKLLEFDSSLAIAFYPDHYTSDGIFYFSVKITPGDYDLYQCEIINDKPINIKRLDEPVSMKNIADLGAVTNFENNILVFQSNNRNNKKQIILYASIMQENGKWGDPVPLSDKINQSITRFASFSRDGKFFFFASSKSGVEEIYWIKSSQLLHNN